MTVAWQNSPVGRNPEQSPDSGYRILAVRPRSILRHRPQWMHPEHLQGKVFLKASRSNVSTPFNDFLSVPWSNSEALPSHTHCWPWLFPRILTMKSRKQDQRHCVNRGPEWPITASPVLVSVLAHLSTVKVASASSGAWPLGSGLTNAVTFFNVLVYATAVHIRIFTLERSVF